MREHSCNSCGGQLGSAARYCKHCGASVSFGRASFLSSPWFLIIGGTVLCAILLFSGVRMVAQLSSELFPRAGFYLSAGVVLVVTIFSFLLGRVWAARAAGLDRTRMRRARRAIQASGFRSPRRVARPVLLAACLLCGAAVVLSLLLKPAKPSDQTAEAAGMTAGAENTSSPTTGSEQSEAMVAEIDPIIKINGIWTLYTQEMSGLSYLQQFVYFDDATAASGTCVAPPEVAVKLTGGTPLNEVTIDATYDYEVTGVSFLDVRGLSEPYISSLEITFRDRAGTSEPFTVTLDINHTLDFSNYHDGGTQNYQLPLSQYQEASFSYDAKAVKTIPSLPVPEPELYGLWIASDSLEAFSSYAVHSNDDIPFLFFYIDTMYIGLCSSAANAREVLMDPDNAADLCTILAQYPFVVEHVTYALQKTRAVPIIDTCWITLQLDQMAALDLFMEEGSLVTWEDNVYQYSEGVEWGAPW